jgi:hypothetical protein
MAMGVKSFLARDCRDAGNPACIATGIRRQDYVPTSAGNMVPYLWFAAERQRCLRHVDLA